VRARLARLPAEAVQVLRFAAVVGREFDRAVLERACGLSAASVLDHLRAASEARLVSKLPSGRYRFDHDLVREVLYDDLDGGELGLAHYKVGSALERISEYQEPRHAAALARHMAQAASHAGASRALDYSIRAGAYALGNFAYEAAVEHFLRARELLPSADVDPATERAVLLDLGLAQVSAGQCEAGRSTLQLAVEKARALRAAEDLAQAALSLASGLFAIETGVYDRALVNLLEEALEQVGHTNQRLRALLLGRLGLALYWSDPYERRARICDEARRLADAVGDDGVLAAVTTARAFALLRPSDLDERSELATAALDLSVRAADVQLSMLNRLLRGAALLERGDVTAAAFEADAFGALAEQTRQPQAVRIVQAHRASRLLLDGRLDDVERFSSACLAAARRVRDHNALLSFGVHLTLARIEQGSAGQVLADVRDYAAGYPLISAACQRRSRRDSSTTVRCSRPVLPAAGDRMPTASSATGTRPPWEPPAPHPRPATSTPVVRSLESWPVVFTLAPSWPVPALCAAGAGVSTALSATASPRASATTNRPRRRVTFRCSQPPAAAAARRRSRSRSSATAS